jgi:hypothetical protein
MRGDGNLRHAGAGAAARRHGTGERLPPWVADLAQGNRHLGLGPGGRIGWQAQDMNPAGACGNAAAATAEKGRMVLDHAGRESRGSARGAPPADGGFLRTAGGPGVSAPSSPWTG